MPRTSSPTASFSPCHAITDRTQSGCSRAAVPMFDPGAAGGERRGKERRQIPEASSGDTDHVFLNAAA